MIDKMKIKRALISVSDKTGLIELAKQLDKYGIEIISTGGTLKKLREADIQVISVSTFTGSPEVMEGRVKTLHPKIHAGILYRRESEKDNEELAQLDSRAIDLVIVNLYPFEKTVARKDASEEEIIENIDIGGPTLIRAASKNFEAVTVIVDPEYYGELAAQLEENDGASTLAFRKKCASRAFSRTCCYDEAICKYFGEGLPSDKIEKKQFPDILSLKYKYVSDLRYGENPHQKAAVYDDPTYPGASLLKAKILSGKELSFNNYGDLDACLGMLLDFKEPFACVLKHANPCGAAVGKDIIEAYKRAYESDPLSAYGSIIGLNKEVDIKCAKELHETFFVECILAPSFTDEAYKLLKKKKARRLLALPGIINGYLHGESAYKPILGGMLVQDADHLEENSADFKVVTKRKPTDAEMKSLIFAWKIVKHTKSNAIVIVKDQATVGVGMGQTSRVDASELAVKRAGDRAKGGVLASDAFFPMPDGVEVATAAGVKAFIQPGGSKGDEQAIEAADKAEASMIFTGARHFRH